MSTRFAVFNVSDTGRDHATLAADVMFQKIVGLQVGLEVVWPQSADATAMALLWAFDVHGLRLTGGRAIDLDQPLSIGELKDLLQSEARLLAYDAQRTIRAAVNAAYFGAA